MKLLLLLLLLSYPGKEMLGWPSLLISLWTLGSMQIFVIGMVGEYIAKIYTEVKRRPRYFIWEELKWHRSCSAFLPFTDNTDDREEMYVGNEEK